MAPAENCGKHSDSGGTSGGKTEQINLGRESRDISTAFCVESYEDVLLSFFLF